MPLPEVRVEQEYEQQQHGCEEIKSAALGKKK